MEYGLIGEHLGHSFSKEIHNKISNYNYKLQEIPKDSLSDFMKNKNFKGINVTIPYKKDVIPYLDNIDEKAKSIGAVNTIVNHSSKLIGYNTDFDGMMSLINKIGLNIEEKKVLILGTGGSSNTAYAVLRALNAGTITKVSRKENPGCITYKEAYESYKDTQIIVNTTPCGMYPNTNKSPIELDYFPKLEGLVDIIYNPLRSKLVIDAQRKGISADGGLYMLVSQAIFASEHFFNIKYQRDLVDKVYWDIHKNKENIVLVGMPGCGKSTVGKILSSRLGREWIDTDNLVEERTGKSPSEIIQNYGLKKFREIESRAIESIHTKNNLVISTGGGAILSCVNTDFLKMNGRIFFLDRDVDLIRPTPNRPLSSDRAKLLEIYNERYPIYNSICDVKIKNNSSSEEAVSNIIAYYEV